MALAPNPSVLSLCSGVGGLDLGVGLVWRGASLLGCVERDAFAARILLDRMESADLEPCPVWAGDLHEFDATPFRGRVDLLTAGYPCQPFSTAGSRLGEDDPRHLWPTVLRIAREVEAPCLVLENVRGHLSLGFDRVLGDLAENGFDAEWTIVRASDAGAPHRRERLFILAYSRRLTHERWGGPGFLRAAAEASCREGLQRERSEHTAGDGGQGDRCLADASHAHGRRGECGEEEGAGPHRLRGRGPSGRGAVFPSRWPLAPSSNWRGAPGWCHPATEPDVRRVVDGPPSLLDLAQWFRTDRLRALGNAVVPDQAALALRELVERIS